MTLQVENSGTPEVVETPTPEVKVETPVTPEVKNTPAVATPEVKTEVTAPSWRNDWREALAKGDPKTLERLARFPSVEAVWDSFREAEKKISSTKPVPTLPANPTPEQLTEYRKAVGVPETHTAYYEKMPDGLVIGEEDKGAVDLLAQSLHGKNVPKDVFDTVVDTYYKIVEQNHNDMVEHQIELKKQSGDALRAEWGADYRPTINAITATLDGLDQETRELVEGMQLSDGSLAFNHKGFMRWMGSLALQINPAAIVVPGNSGGDKLDSIKNELAGMEAEMRKNINAWQHPSNDHRRERYIQLLDAQSKFEKR